MTVRDTDEFHALKQGHQGGGRLFTASSIRMIRDQWERGSHAGQNQEEVLVSMARSWGCGINAMRDIVKRHSYKDVL